MDSKITVAAEEIDYLNKTARVSRLCRKINEELRPIMAPGRAVIQRIETRVIIFSRSVAEKDIH